MDAADLFADVEPADADALLATCLEQIAYHREELRRWLRLKRLAEQAIPKTPVDEMLDIAGDAWQR